MDKLWLNSKIIKPESNKSHVVKYYIYHEDGDNVTESLDPTKNFVNVHRNNNSICFASLLSEIKQYKKTGQDINRIMYFIQDRSYKDKLDEQEKTDWITIAKQSGVLPEYVTNEMVLSGRPVIKLVDINPSLLYVYLSALRVIQENQSFVRAMLYLVAVYRMNFSAAWALSSRLVITNSWHNIIELGRSYGQKSTNDINDITVPLHLIIGMHRYLKEPTKHDKRDLISKNSYPYKVHDTISRLCTIQKNIIAGDLFQQSVIDAINSDTDMEAKKYLKEYKPA